MHSNSNLTKQAQNLSQAATLVEESAYALAGHISTAQIAHLMLLSSELERTASNVNKQPDLTLVNS
jgi:hypothetical protein